MALIDYSVDVLCGNIIEIDLIFNLANKAIPKKNGVLDILNHMVRSRNTCSQAHEYFLSN